MKEEKEINNLTGTEQTTSENVTQETTKDTSSVLSAEPESTKKTAKVKKAKSRKEKSPLPPSKRKKKTAIVSTIIAICCGLVGGIAGYEIYGVINPSGKTSIYVPTTSGFDPADTAALAKYQTSLSKGTIVKDYSSSPWDLLNYAFYLKSMSTYSLTIGKSTVNATSLGVNVVQSIESATYSTPNENFNQNVSSSSFVHTANRFYDKKDGNVISYIGHYASDWTATMEGSSVTYDNYIQQNGKLIKGLYYTRAYTSEEKASYIQSQVDAGVNETEASTSFINEKYLADSLDSYIESTSTSKKAVQAEVIYAINSGTVKSSECSLVKNDDGTYKIDLVMDDAKGACYYYAHQMLTTGGLNDYPTFSASSISFVLDENLHLVSSYFTDQYVAKAFGMNADSSQTMTQYYFQSDTNTFTNGQSSVKVTIPTMSETDFNGYQLWPISN